MVQSYWSWLLYWGLTPLQELRSYHGGRWRACVSWLSHTSTNTNFFPKPPTTFLTCFSRGERRKYAGKKFHLKRDSNSQPPGHESDTLTPEPPGRGIIDHRPCLWQSRKHCGKRKKGMLVTRTSSFFQYFQNVSSGLLKHRTRWLTPS